MCLFSRSGECGQLLCAILCDSGPESLACGESSCDTLRPYSYTYLGLPGESHFGDQTVRLGHIGPNDILLARAATHLGPK